MERTLRWLARCQRAAERPEEQALFGIVQGGTERELRLRSAEQTVALDLDGYAVGGLAVGEDKALTFATVEVVTARLPADRPRYLMGMGTPSDLVEAVARGIDMFDSVLPTRDARHARVFTSEGRVNLRNARFARDERPLDPACGCETCRGFSRAYLRHLVQAREILAPVLLTLHNLRFYLDTMTRIRQAIASRRFEEVRQELRSMPGAG
jgi:queuine tRNA-ribosyltransferase